MSKQKLLVESIIKVAPKCIWIVEETDKSGRVYCDSKREANRFVKCFKDRGILTVASKYVYRKEAR